MRNKMYLIAAIALSVVTVAGCGKKEDAAAKKAGQAQAANQATPVTVVPARSETLLRLVPVTGSLIALQSVELYPKISARVVSVSGREGDTVSAGQVVAQLDTDDLRRQVEQAQANVDTARVRLEQAQTTYQTSRTTSDVAVKDAQEAVRAAEAQLALTRTPQRSQEVIVAENNVKQAQANYDKAVSDRKRYAELFKEGATAAITLDQYVTQEKVAQANLNSAKQQLAIAREGGRRENIAAQEAQVARARQALRQAEANRSNVSLRQDDISSARATLSQAQAALQVARQAVSDASLRSPITGVISDRKIEPGQLANPATSVAQVVALNTVYFEAQINEQDVAGVRQGQQANVRLDAYPNRVFTGKVVKVFPTGDATGRTFNARIQLPNVGSTLRPGLFARGEIVTQRLPGSVTVPVEALIRDQDGQARGSVYTETGGVVKKNTVTIGITTPDASRVQVDGIAAGENVIVVGQRGVKEGDKVDAKSPETENESTGTSPSDANGSGTPQGGQAPEDNNGAESGTAGGQ